MPDPRDNDLIRRSEITRLLTEADDRIADPEDRLRVIANGLVMLPADPVAAAAVALAEELVKDIDDFACAVEFYITLETKEALSAYRSAIAGRERGR